MRKRLIEQFCEPMRKRECVALRDWWNVNDSKHFYALQKAPDDWSRHRGLWVVVRWPVTGLLESEKPGEAAGLF